MDYGLYKRLVLSIDYCLWTMFQIIPELNCPEQVTALYHIFDGLFLRIRISPELDYFLWPMFYDPFSDFDGLKRALFTAYFGKRAVKNEEKGRQTTAIF